MTQYVSSTELDYNDDRSLLDYAKQCVHEWDSEYAENITQAKLQRRFIYAENGQWDAITLSDRQQRNKSCLTENMLRAIQRKIVAEQMENDPQILAVPVNTKIPTEIVKTKTGLIQEISYRSDTRSVYSHIYTDMIDCGYAAGYVTVEPESPKSFNNELTIKMIPDALMAIFDPASTHPHKTDGRFSGFYESYSRDCIKNKCTDFEFQENSFPAPDGVDYLAPDKSTIILLNFYCKRYIPVNLVKLDDGTEMKSSTYSRIKKQVEKQNENNRKQAKKDKLDYQEITIPKKLKRIKSTDYVIEYYLMSQNRILERKTLPIKKMPVVYFCGDKRYVNNKEMTIPYAIDARTPQQGLNYCISEIIDGISNSFGTRVIAQRETVEQSLQTWARPGIHAIALYDPPRNISTDYRPSILSTPVIDPTLLSIYGAFQDAVKMVLGRYNDNMGEQSNAIAGVAITQRQMSGDLAVGVYPSNLNAGIGEIAKILLEWMPFVYDTERSVKIMNKSGRNEYTTINEVTGELDEYGNVIKKNDMTYGDFTVEVSGGPSFAAQRMAGMQFLAQMSAGDDKLKSLTYDLLLEMSPFPFSNELIRRLRESGYINQEVLADEAGEPMPPKEPSMMEKMAQMNMKLEMMEAMAKIKRMKFEEQKQKIELAGKVIELKAQLKETQLESGAKIAEAYAQVASDKIKYQSEVITQAIESEASIVESMVEIEKDAVELQSQHLASIGDSLQSLIDKQAAAIDKAVNNASKERINE